jgi:DNA-binding transcriptional regulator GbsR (MarR family)
MDNTELAEALKAIQREPAEEVYEKAIWEARREVIDKVEPLMDENIEAMDVLKEEFHREAESIRKFLEKVDRRRKLVALAWHIRDAFAWVPNFGDSSMAREMEHVDTEIQRLREEIESDQVAHQALERISRLQDTISDLERKRKPFPGVEAS